MAAAAFQLAANVAFDTSRSGMKQTVVVIRVMTTIGFWTFLKMFMPNATMQNAVAKRSTENKKVAHLVSANVTSPGQPMNCPSGTRKKSVIQVAM